MKIQFVGVLITLVSFSNVSFAQSLEPEKANMTTPLESILDAVLHPCGEKGGSNSGGGRSKGGSNSGGGITDNGDFNSGAADEPIQLKIKIDNILKAAVQYLSAARMNKSLSAEHSIKLYQEFLSRTIGTNTASTNSPWLNQHSKAMMVLSQKLTELQSKSDLQLDLLDHAVSLVVMIEGQPSFVIGPVDAKSVVSASDRRALNAFATKQLNFILETLFIGGSNLLRYSPNEQNAVLDTLGTELAWEFAPQTTLANDFTALKDIEKAEDLKIKINSIITSLK